MSVLDETAIRNADNYYIGKLTEQVRELEAKLAAKVRDEWPADKYRKACKHRDDLGDWLVDQATANGELTKYTIDAALGGEDFVPNSFTRIVNGTKYAFELVSTVYSVTEAE